MLKKIRVLLLSVLLCALAASACAETMTLSFVGDCTTGDQWSIRGYGSTFTYKVSRWGMDWPFSNVRDMFEADDLTIANCEVVLTDGTPGSYLKYMTLGGATKFGQVFKEGFVDVCNIANNHAKDFGPDGRQSTIDTLTALGIGVFGDNELYETEIKGVKIGIVGYTYPINAAKMERYKESIAKLQDDGCTFIIASAHWGKEEGYKLTQSQRDYGPALIDAGADLVYGHGSHTVEPIQIYNGHVIFYSLSNFTFGANGSPKDPDTVVMQVVFDINEDGTMTAAELYAYPYCMHKQRDYRPWPYTEEKDRLRVLEKLVSTQKGVDSNVPESFLTTGYIDLRAWCGEGVDSNADCSIVATPTITYVAQKERREKAADLLASVSERIGTARGTVTAAHAAARAAEDAAALKNGLVVLK